MSLGIFNISLALMKELVGRPGMSPMHVYAQRTMVGRLPPGVVAHEVNATGLVRRVFWEQWGVFSAACRDGADWLILPKGFGSAVRRPPLKTAAYVHDIMAATYFDRYPAHGDLLKQFYFVRTLDHTLRSADVVLTNTEFTRREILAWASGRKIERPLRIEVVGYGLPPAVTPAIGREDMILVDVRDCPHKRTDLALDYLGKWREQTRFEGRFVCVGRLPAGLALPDDATWRALGRVPAERYFDLMRTARAHVHFTEYEGFGLPSAEAVMNGTPAVFSSIEVTQEVMSGTGCPFSNTSFESFAEAMSRAIRTTRDEILGWQATLGEKHSWAKTGDRVLRALT